MYSKSIITVLFLVLFSESLGIEEKSYSELKSCNVGALAEEIAAYKPVVDRIIDYAVNGAFKGRTYNELAKYVDKFGSRFTGTENLERSIDYLSQISHDEEIHDITTELVEVPLWKRGEEKLTMLQPRKKNMALIGLGLSISTPPEGITAEVIVVSNLTVLENTADEHIKGKIVVYDTVFTRYGVTVQSRLHGASRAAAKGAVAALIRSVAPFSINSPHAGYMVYETNVTKIPSAAITLEDADLLKRMYDKGEKVVLHLKMNSTQSRKISKNTLMDILGSQDPDKYVIISGHVDSWDVGEGASDDGGGVFVTWSALAILRNLDLTPKRTIRGVFWTAEEFGLIGAKAFAQSHQFDDIVFAMESDEGTFTPLGLAVAGSQQTRCVVAEILKLFKSINATTLKEDDHPGSDIDVFTSRGIPRAGLYTADERYFWFQHTAGDTLTVENSEDLDLGAALWAAAAYVVADMSVDMPH